ncbi:hypothetical protein PR048_029531 [Dryococelus australis]|uniref:MADF domain-containing protein n=1 Tax=Dryococelus australis TaxID=614101 RepID=A0ABQ9GFX8_9NEOP|nr:hypothetical protein PR048_029531 [Dryococelus australis]
MGKVRKVWMHLVIMKGNAMACQVQKVVKQVQYRTLQKYVRTRCFMKWGVAVLGTRQFVLREYAYVEALGRLDGFILRSQHRFTRSYGVLWSERTLEERSSVSEVPRPCTGGTAMHTLLGRCFYLLQYLRPHTKDEVDRPRWLRTANLRVPTFNCFSAKHMDINIPRRKQTRVRFPAGLLPDFRIWESGRTMPLAGGFPQGSSDSKLHTHLVSPASALKTSISLVRKSCDRLTGSDPVLRLAGELSIGLGRAGLSKVRSPLPPTLNCTRRKARTLVLQLHVAEEFKLEVRRKAVDVKVSTFEINLRKKSLPRPAYILTGALSGMRPVKLVTMEGKMESGQIRLHRSRRCTNVNDSQARRAGIQQPTSDMAGIYDRCATLQLTDVGWGGITNGHPPRCCGGQGKLASSMIKIFADLLFFFFLLLNATHLHWFPPPQFYITGTPLPQRGGGSAPCEGPWPPRWRLSTIRIFASLSTSRRGVCNVPAAVSSTGRASRQAARRVHVQTCGDMCTCPRSGKLTVSGRIALAEGRALFTVKMSAEFIIDCNIQITLVQERPVLWDKTTEEYKDRRFTLEAWNEVFSLLKEDFETLPDAKRNRDKAESCPTVDEFNEEDIVDFQFEVMKLIRDIRKKRSNSGMPPQRTQHSFNQYALHAYQTVGGPSTYRMPHASSTTSVATSHDTPWMDRQIRHPVNSPVQHSRDAMCFQSYTSPASTADSKTQLTSFRPPAVPMDTGTRFFFRPDGITVPAKILVVDRSPDVVRLLASHLSEPSSIPVVVTPGFSHVGIVPDDATGRRVSSGISHFPHPCTLALLYTHLTSPSSALKTSMFLSGAHRIASNHDVFGGQVVDYKWGVEFQCWGTRIEMSNTSTYTHKCKINNEYSAWRFNFPRKESTETRMIASDTHGGQDPPKPGTPWLQSEMAPRGVLAKTVFETIISAVVVRSASGQFCKERADCSLLAAGPGCVCLAQTTSQLRRWTNMTEAQLRQLDLPADLPPNTEPSKVARGFTPLPCRTPNVTHVSFSAQGFFFPPSRVVTTVCIVFTDESSLFMETDGHRLEEHSTAALFP